MNLEDYSKDELLAELRRRDEDTESVREDIPCVGIIDDRGLDSIVAVENAVHFAQLSSSMELRCRFNTQRNAEMFFIKIPLKLLEALKEEMNHSDHSAQKAGKVVKELSNYKKIF